MINELADPAVLPGFTLHLPQHPCRGEVEQFIRTHFSLQYGAQVEHFLPLLLGLRDRRQRLHAALGLRSANTGPLFLEGYLDAPVEQMLTPHARSNVGRSRIVEIGNLASNGRGSTRLLIPMLAKLLLHNGYEWIVCTIPPLLNNAFTRLGLSLIDLGPAELMRLPAAEQHRWGSYYAQGPRVMAGRIADALPLLQAQVLSGQAA